MAKFCTYCGSALPENGVCSCELSAAAREGAAQAAAAAAAAENQYVKKTKETARQVAPFVKDYWASPMNATLRAMRDNNMIMAIVMMVINALVTGLFLFTCYSKLAGSVRSAFEDLAGMFGEAGKIDISVPFFSCILSGIVIAAIAMALSALLMFLLLKIMKIDVKFNYIIIAVGVNSVLCTACIVLALLCTLIGWVTPMMIFLLLGVVVWAVAGVLVLTKVFGATPTGLMMVLTSVFFVVALAITCWLGSKLAISAAGGIEVEDYKLSEAFEDLEDSMDDLDADSIMEGLVGSMF